MSEETRPENGRIYGHYNPVSVQISEAVGTTFLGLLTVILLVALLRVLQENRRLTAVLARHEGATGKQIEKSHP